jgi:rod shape-determining protein MreD
VRRIAAVWGLALAGLWVVGAASAWVPPGWLPDPALVVAVALGLRAPGAPGALGAWLVGWSADLLSAGPPGTHALLDLVSWALTRAGQRRVDLARPVILVPFVVGLTAVHTVGMWAIGALPAVDRVVVHIALVHAIANAAVVLATQPAFDALLGRFEADEPARGSLRLDAGAGLR